MRALRAVIQRLRPLLHAASAIVLGTLWFSLLVTLWATGLGLAVTLLGPAGHLAHARAPRALDGRGRGRAGPRAGSAPTSSAPPPTRLGRCGRGLKDRRSGTRSCTCCCASSSASSSVRPARPGRPGLGLLVAPLWYWAVPDGIDSASAGRHAAGGVRGHPAGLRLVAADLWLAGPLRTAGGALAERLLHGERAGAQPPALAPRSTPITRRARWLEAVCLVVWLRHRARRSLAGVDGDRPDVVVAGTIVGRHRGAPSRRFNGLVVGRRASPVWAASPAAATSGRCGRRSGIAIGIAVDRVVERLGSACEQLTRTRADVVGAQEDELRRIERDLHDGAQARLVSLAMSLGLAESRLDEDPERARELMAEAQDQARDGDQGAARPRPRHRPARPPGPRAARRPSRRWPRPPAPVEVRGDRERAPGRPSSAPATSSPPRRWPTPPSTPRAGRMRRRRATASPACSPSRSPTTAAAAPNPHGSGLVAPARGAWRPSTGASRSSRAAGQGTTVRASLPCASS